MTITQTTPKSDDLKVFTLQEVSTRNGKDSELVWIVIKDAVYDVTNYIENHPGGPELVTEYAGTDCTKFFNDAGHSVDAIKELKNWKIGELVEEDKKANRGKVIKASNDYSRSTSVDSKKKKKLGGFLFC